MLTHLSQLTVTVAKTANGAAEFLQIMSPAALPVNIVLVADHVLIVDAREAVAP